MSIRSVSLHPSLVHDPRHCRSDIILQSAAGGTPELLLKRLKLLQRLRSLSRDLQEVGLNILVYRRLQRIV